jgi:transcriptional regulator with XRE-family HTH domain
MPTPAQHFLVLGDRITVFRQRKGWTVVELAAELGELVARVRAWENGTLRPLQGDLARLIAALGCDPQELAPPSGPPIRPGLGAAIRTLRIGAGLDQKALANRCRWSNNKASALENDRVGLTDDELARVALVLGVAVTQLLHGAQATARAPDFRRGQQAPAWTPAQEERPAAVAPPPPPEAPVTADEEGYLEVRYLGRPPCGRAGERALLAGAVEDLLALRRMRVQVAGLGQAPRPPEAETIALGHELWRRRLARLREGPAVSAGP